MTITTYTSKSRPHRGLLILFCLGITICVGLIIQSYSKQVSMNRTKNILKRELGEETTKNIDIKNKLYTLLDFKESDALGKQWGLIKEAKPHFISELTR